MGTSERSCEKWQKSDNNIYRKILKNHYSERFGGCTERNNINLKNVNECHQLKSKPTALLIIPRFFVGVPASGPVG